MGLHHAYYGFATGRWDGHFVLSDLDVGGLHAQVPTARDVVALRLLARIDRWAGPTALTTIVEPTPDPDRFEHTTRLHRDGLTLYRAHRVLRLHDDGVALSIDGWEQTRPFKPVPLRPSEGVVTSPTTASYAMWMTGARWDIAFTIGPHAAGSTVTTPWAHGEEHLTRP